MHKLTPSLERLFEIRTELEASSDPDKERKLHALQVQVKNYMEERSASFYDGI